MPSNTDLEAEKAKMRRNMEALYGALGNASSVGSVVKSPPPSALHLPSASPRTMDRKELPRSPRAPLLATARIEQESPLGTVAPSSQPPLLMAVTSAAPTMPPIPKPQTATPTEHGTIIVLNGELQETRGALEAERLASAQLSTQLAEMGGKVARMVTERDTERAELQRARTEQRQAEDQARAVRVSQDDALRRLHAMQQEVTSARYAHERALAEARAERDAAVQALQRSEAETQRVALGSGGEAQALRAEAASLREQVGRLQAELRHAQDNARRGQHALKQQLEAELHTAQTELRTAQAELRNAQAELCDVQDNARRERHALEQQLMQATAKAAEATAKAAARSSAVSSRADATLAQMAADGVAATEFVQAAVVDLDGFARALAVEAKAQRSPLMMPDAVAGKTFSSSFALAPPLIVAASAVATPAAATPPLSALPGSAAAAAAVVRVAELEATVAELEARLQMQSERGADAVHTRQHESAARAVAAREAEVRAAEVWAAARAEGLLEGEQRARDELAHAVRAAGQRVAELEAATAAAHEERVAALALAKQHEDARAEQEKMLLQRIEVLEERRRETTREQAEAEAARREAEAANTAKATAESRLAEREQQLTAFEAERRAWRADLEASGQRVRALEAAVEKHEQLKKAFERDIADMKVNAERRAREKLAVREMSDEARATAAARPSVELLKENERLRRELNEMHREGARRTNEAVAAMASLAARQVGRGLNPSDHEAASPARAASPRRGGGGNAPLFKDLD
jgi:chromosome segregation ATPase